MRGNESIHRKQMAKWQKSLLMSNHFFKILFIYFRQRGREGEREGEKHQCVVASCAPPTGDLTWPATQACALTGNWTSDPLVHRPALNPLSHTSQSSVIILNVNTLQVSGKAEIGRMDIKKHAPPWLVWLSGLSASLRTKGSLVQFPVRAHAWVAEATTHWCFSPSPSPPFSSLKISK